MPPLGQVPPGAFRPLRTPLTTPLKVTKTQVKKTNPLYVNPPPPDMWFDWFPLRTQNLEFTLSYALHCPTP